MFRTLSSKNQGLEIDMVPFTVTTSDPPAKVLPSVPEVLCSAGLEVLVSKQGMLPPEDTLMISLN